MLMRLLPAMTPPPQCLEMDTIPKVGVGKNSSWRQSSQIARIAQSSRWPCRSPQPRQWPDPEESPDLLRLSIVDQCAPSLTAAAADFGLYNYIVLGETLEETSHPDHANTVTILADLPSTTTAFGYIDLANNPGPAAH